MLIVILVDPVLPAQVRRGIDGQRRLLLLLLRLHALALLDPRNANPISHDREREDRAPWLGWISHTTGAAETPDK